MYLERINTPTVVHMVVADTPPEGTLATIMFMNIEVFLHQALVEMSCMLSLMNLPIQKLKLGTSDRHMHYKRWGFFMAYKTCKLFVWMLMNK